MDTGNLAILHLSDIHFVSGANPIASRVAEIAATVRAQSEHIAACVIVVSGDIALSGRTEEYEIAEKFLRSVHAVIEKDHAGCLVDFVIIPGNHDCDLRGNLELRTMAMDNMSQRLESLDPGGPVVATCLAVQEAFFGFYERVCGAPLDAADRLYYERELVIGSNVIRFQCHNSAWISQNPEHQGQLLYPIVAASKKDSPSRMATVAVSLVHHPFNWYTAANARAFREFLERTSDLILTGHEHVPAMYLRESHTGATVAYVEGAVLQESDSPDESGFHLFIVNLQERKYSYNTYKWMVSAYTRSFGHESAPFHRNPLLAQHAFDNSQEFLGYLLDPGTAFSHPRRRDLTLPDLFVYPNLTRRAWIASQMEDPNKTRVSSGSLLDFVSDKGNVVITGEANAGKTSLLKSLYLDLRRRKGVVPLFLRGSDLRGARARNLRKVCKAAFSRQYDGGRLEQYEQLEIAQRLLLIDDFDEARLTAKARQDFLDSAKEHASSVVIAADHLFMVDLLSNSGESTREAFKTFELCTIREFGYSLRGKLITKWHSIGNEVTVPEGGLTKVIADCEKTVNTLIGKGLFPSFPMTILTIIQTMEAATTPSMAAGSYGYLYEALITTSLSRATNKAATLDTKYTYLSILAHAMYQEEVEQMSFESVERLTAEYFRVYRLNFSLDQVLRELEEGRILEQSHGQVYFKYKYIYCYFVARYMRDKVSGSTEVATRDALIGMADRIHYEDHANILIFYIYLTRDPVLINYLIKRAGCIYADHLPCNLDSDVAFINDLYVDTRPLLLPAGEAAEHREEERARLDASDADEEPNHPDVRSLVYADDLGDLLKLNFAFKTLNVLGHVLRNFHGSLDGAVKREIAIECYGLGLRSLKAVFRIAETNIEDIRTYFARLIREHRSVTDVAELAQSTDGALIWLTLGCAFGVIKRVSTAVGLQELKGTYSDVLEELGPMVPARLIDVCIKLDHFDAMPIAEIEKLSRELYRNHFTRRVLRDLVGNYMYLNDVSYRSRQKLGSMLDIRSTDASYLENPDKQTK